MESNQFDNLTRKMAVRRMALLGLAGGIVGLLGLSGGEEAGAHNPLPNCRRIGDPDQRRKCLRRARAHKRKQHSCRPQPVAITCANRCGSVRDNCRKGVNCACPAGKTGLVNNGCSRTCDETLLSCPVGCTCGVRLIEDDTPHCFSAAVAECTQVPQICTSTAQCPTGQFCGQVFCGPNDTAQGRCIPNCPF